MELKQTKKSNIKTKVFFKLKSDYADIPDFGGELEQVRVLYKETSVEIYIGLGDNEKKSLNTFRMVGARAIKEVKILKKNQCAIFVDKVFDKKEFVHALVEGIILGGYSFEKYKTKDDKNKIEKVEIVCEKDVSNEIKEATIISQSVIYTRDLVNENAEVTVPEHFAQEARGFAKTHKMKCKILDEKELQKQGLGLLYAVGKGAAQQPRLIILEYNGDKSSKKKIALVGKGLTFDTGGLNLKPSGSMETMKSDMSGAGAVLGTMKVISELGLKVNVIAVIPAACNAISNTSYFPGDVYKSYSGKTVCILNTDAEGRLILADAISYVVKNYKPDCLVDIATLTGAMTVIFSKFIAGLFSNNDDMAKALFKAGEKTSERLWQLPIYDEYREAMKGEVADFNNMSNLGRGEGGSIAAAAFLEAFVENTPWAHIDIASVAYNEKGARGYTPKFATGYGVRLLVEWIKNI